MCWHLCRIAHYIAPTNALRATTLRRTAAHASKQLPCKHGHPALRRPSTASRPPPRLHLLTACSLLRIPTVPVSTQRPLFASIARRQCNWNAFFRSANWITTNSRFALTGIDNSNMPDNEWCSRKRGLGRPPFYVTAHTGSCGSLLRLFSPQWLANPGNDLRRSTVTVNCRQQ